MNQRKYYKNAPSRLFLLLLALVILFPLALIFVSSFLTSDEAGMTYAGIFQGKQFASFVLMPARPDFQPYADLFLYCGQFYTMFWNSVRDTALITIGQVLTAVPAAWAFAKLCFPLKKIWFTVYLIVMMLPFQITMLSNYFILDRTGLLNTPWAFILPCIFSTFPVFVMTRFFADVPDEMIEAACMDGAGSWQVFCHLGLPLGKSGIAAVAVLQILETWNTVEQPMFFIQNPDHFPLSLFFPNLTAETLGSSFVAAIVMMLPPVFVFLYGKEELAAGIGHIGIEK